MGNCLKLPNRLTKLCPCARIRYRSLQEALHDPNMAGEQANSFPIHGVRKEGGTSTHPTQNRRCRHVEILEHEFPNRRRTQPHLFELLAHPEPRSVTFDEKACDTTIISLFRVSDRKDN